MQRVGDSLESDRDAVLLAVANYGMGLPDESLEGDRDFVLAAAVVQRSGTLPARIHLGCRSARKMNVCWGTPTAASSATAAVAKNGLA